MSDLTTDTRSLSMFQKGFDMALAIKKRDPSTQEMAFTSIDPAYGVLKAEFVTIKNLKSLQSVQPVAMGLCSDFKQSWKKFHGFNKLTQAT